MQISREAIDSVKATVEAAAGDYAQAVGYPDPPIADAPLVAGALNGLAAEWSARLEADEQLFDSVVQALDTVWLVMSNADSELAEFLDQTRVMDR